MQSNESWLKKNNNFPWCTGCTSVNTAQEAFGSLCCQCTLLGDDQLAVGQDAQGLLNGAAFHDIRPYPVMLSGVLSCQAWDAPLCTTHGFCPLNPACLDLLDGSPVLKCNHESTYKFGAICKLDKDTLTLFSAFYKDIKWDQPQDRPLGTALVTSL